ncbi:MAG: hypothetical protein JSV24_11305, partial [Bacteroidales bacterium]
MKIKDRILKEIPRRRFLDLTLKGGITLVSAPAIVSNLWSCQSLATEGSAVEPDQGLLNRVLQKALEKGGEFGEIYIENRISRNITMEESKFKSGTFGITKGAGVRVISGDKTGYAYTDDLSEESLIRAAEVASYVAQGAKITPPVDIQEGSRESFITVEIPLKELADGNRLDVIQRANQAALDYDPKIKMAIIDYYDEVRGRRIANSEGLYLSDELPQLFFIVQA